jgi:succinate dehydrogenase/fumarate reductase flavoprotein subunit
MVTYSGDKPKEIALQELRVKLYGDQRWVEMFWKHATSIAHAFERVILLKSLFDKKLNTSHARALWQHTLSPDNGMVRPYVLHARLNKYRLIAA